MKKISFFDFMNQKKPLSHVSFLVLSVVMTLITSLSGKLNGYPLAIYGMFSLLFLQLEVFIFLGNCLFSKLSFDRSPGEITRIVLGRFIIFLTGCLIGALILYLILLAVFAVCSGENISAVISNFFHAGFMDWFKSTITGLSGGALIFIIILWQSSLQREQKLREENLIFQNETLKNQVNPHFLFNNLNTLSSLIVSEPDTAEIFIHHLSAIYRYILENSSRDKVPLESELTFINDYFFLHKIRDKEKIHIQINIGMNEKYEILPVSLQVLVENAIKHNKATRDSPLTILIYIEDNYIIVRNNLQKMSTVLGSTRIGLKNLAQRVKLVTGKELIINETNSEFIVKIPLI